MPDDAWMVEVHLQLVAPAKVAAYVEGVAIADQRTDLLDLVPITVMADGPAAAYDE